jgi:hypothetical protein
LDFGIFNNLVDDDIAENDEMDLQQTLEQEQEEVVPDEDNASLDSGLNRTYSDVSESASTIDEEEFL